MEYVKNRLGFWRQVDPKPFVYDEKYKSQQGTNEFMSCLRLGFLAGHFGYRLKRMTAVDFGSGNGSFVEAGRRIFGRMVGYDVAGESISKEELLRTKWDVVVMTDVLEHLPEIDFLFEIPWRYALISFPETPEVESFRQLEDWRHFKPNEHLWCLNHRGMRKWLKAHGCRIIRVSDFEDLIRTRWQDGHRNITSILVRRR